MLFSFTASLASLDQTLRSPSSPQKDLFFPLSLVFVHLLFFFLLTKCTTVISRTGDLVPPNGPFGSCSADGNDWAAVVLLGDLNQFLRPASFRFHSPALPGPRCDDKVAKHSARDHYEIQD